MELLGVACASPELSLGGWCVFHFALLQPGFCSSCLAFAARAGNGEPRRNHTLGRIYDEVCRRQWSQSSFRGDAEHVEYKVQEDLLTRANDLYDNSMKDAKARVAPAAPHQGASLGCLFSLCWHVHVCSLFMYTHRKAVLRECLL